MNHVKTVQAIYEAFGRGDVAAILTHVDEDVSWDQWDAPGRAQQLVPYIKPRRGHKQVTEFFKDVAATLQIHRFEPIGFFESDDHVLTRIRLDTTLKPTGKRIQDDEIHLFRFDGQGKVAAFRHFFDTFKHAEAMSPGDR